jgi:PIN domain nuclease of toxin-antitoxin system
MYLLDTHALVWGISVPEQLPGRVRDILTRGEVTVSVVSYWELILKKGRQTALVADPKAWWDQYITRMAVEVLPVRVAHLDQLDALPELHRDPFDRMLVAQTLAENYTLLSRDAVVARYGAPILWE